MSLTLEQLKQFNTDYFLHNYWQHVSVVKYTVESLDDHKTPRNTPQLRIRKALLESSNLLDASYNVAGGKKVAVLEELHLTPLDQSQDEDYIYFDITTLNNTRNDANKLKTLARDLTSFFELSHTYIMQRNPNLIPLFHAEMELKLLRKQKNPSDNEEIQRIQDCLMTTKDIVDVFEILLDENSTQKVSYQLANSKGKYQTYEDQTRADLLKSNALNKLLNQLHHESKSLHGTKKGWVIGGLMMAFGMMIFAAGVAISTTLIVLPIGAAIAAGGLALTAGGLAVANNRQHFSKIGRLMDKHYTFFKKAGKEYEPKSSLLSFLPKNPPALVP